MTSDSELLLSAPKPLSQLKIPPIRIQNTFKLISCKSCDKRPGKPRRAYKNMKQHFLRPNRNHPESHDKISVTIICACEPKNEVKFDLQLYKVTPYERIKFRFSIKKV